MLVDDDEADILWLFKIVLESDARLKVDSFADPIVALENFRPGLYDPLLINIAIYKIMKLDAKVIIYFLTANEAYYEEIKEEVFPQLETNALLKNQ